MKKDFSIGLDAKFIVNDDPFFLEMVDYPKTFDYILIQNNLGGWFAMGYRQTANYRNG